MRVIFVVRAHNCMQSISQCLTSIYSQSFLPDKVVCVDQAPSVDDGTEELAKTLSMRYGNTCITFQKHKHVGLVLQDHKDDCVYWVLDGRDQLGYSDAVRDVVVFMEAWGACTVYGPSLYVLRLGARRTMRVHLPQEPVVAHTGDSGTRLTRPRNWCTDTHLV